MGRIVFGLCMALILVVGGDSLPEPLKSIAVPIGCAAFILVSITGLYKRKDTSNTDHNKEE
jgi:hypothetical protein